MFGYYNATPVDGGLFLPNGIVFSCLSHDIVAHETTHALLDGIYNRFMETTRPDVAGFHEGFSDLIALLQHFTHSEIVFNQIKAAKGRLDTENMLMKLAVEFGKSTGEYKSLRDAIGKTVKGKWKRTVPHVTDYGENLECHERGALLVSAVFDAFIAIYKTRTADLIRIATGGTGIIPVGDINTDLAGRLAEEASRTAGHVMTMCVRALDYCPPVDIHYGDYLRALITADKELVPYDEHQYRVAFINAFCKRGIFPQGVPNLSVDTLCYNALEDEGAKAGFSENIVEFLRTFKDKLAYKTKREEIFTETQKFIAGEKGLHSLLFTNSNLSADAVNFENITGLIISAQYKNFGIAPSKTYGSGIPSIAINSLRLLNKIGPDGNQLNHIVMTLIESCEIAVSENSRGEKVFGMFNPKNQAQKDGEHFTFRGGCTLIFDLDELKLRHAIRKPIFEPCSLSAGNRKLKYNMTRLNIQYRSMIGDLTDKIGFAPPNDDGHEPFAFLHQAKIPVV